MTSVSGVINAAMDCTVQRLPGVQLFTIREALATDPDAALGRLAAAGVKEVELYGLTGAPEIFGMPLQSFRNLLDRHGLAMTCSHVNAGDLDIPALGRNAKVLGLDTIILAMAPGFMQAGPAGMRVQGPQSLAEVEELVALLNRLGRMFNSEGLRFAYHNHHVEFFPVAGEIPYDVIMTNTDPQLVHCELDIGWLALARVNYVDYLNRYGDRTVSCHLKDFNGNNPRDMGDFLAVADNLVAPGSGIIDFAAVLERMDYYGIRHGFVEIDRPRNAFSDIAAGQRHLQSLRQCN
jgi:sugar phosphate isomerase/epimerase